MQKPTTILASRFLASGRVDEAIAHYQEALKIRPDYADASCNLASALLSKGDLDGAIAYYSSLPRALAKSG